MTNYNIRLPSYGVHKFVVILFTIFGTLSFVSMKTYFFIYVIHDFCRNLRISNSMVSVETEMTSTFLYITSHREEGKTQFLIRL